MNILRIYYKQYELLLNMQTKDGRILPETFKVHPVFRDVDGNHPMIGEAIDLSLTEAKIILPIKYLA
jgi:hypothetical protein